MRKERHPYRCETAMGEIDGYGSCPFPMPLIFEMARQELLARLSSACARPRALGAGRRLSLATAIFNCLHAV